MDLTGLGSVAKFGEKVVGLVEGLFPAKMSEADKAQAQLGVQKLTQDFQAETMNAQRDIIVSEMAQGDNFTKRARPALVYMGLAFIAINHVLFPILAWFFIAFTDKAIGLPALTLPTEFWWSWTGVCSAWVIGRSYEKAGGVSRIAAAITGGKSS